MCETKSLQSLWLDAAADTGLTHQNSSGRFEQAEEVVG
ncbi:MAG: hypothetical protein FD140_4897, partial [Limisphaerales bacterium]